MNITIDEKEQIKPRKFFDIPAKERAGKALIASYYDEHGRLVYGGDNNRRVIMCDSNGNVVADFHTKSGGTKPEDQNSIYTYNTLTWLVCKDYIINVTL